MQQITKPQPLDPDRPLHNNRSQFFSDDEPESEALTSALHESCAYAEQLWETLNCMREYLLDSLPADPKTMDPDTTPAVGTSPTGPDDELGWTKWVDAFAAVTSTLCGPNGDSGFGRSRAREQAAARRMAPTPRQRTSTDDPVSTAPRSQPLAPGATKAAPGGANRPASRQSRRRSGAAAVGLVVAGAVVGSLRPRRVRN